MAKIADRKPGRKDGGYTRVFNNENLGALFSQVHATSISAGTELEKMIFIANVDDLDKFLEESASKNYPAIATITKSVLKKSKEIDVNGKEPDGIIFLMSEKECKIIELKDGDTFDTKKVEGEIETLEKVTNIISRKVPYKVQYYICGFNSKNKEDLKIGLKNRLSEKNLMTGKELCEVLKLNYDGIIQKREKDSSENLDYFLRELLKIGEIRNKIEAILLE